MGLVENFIKTPSSSFLGAALRYPLRWIPKGISVPILQGRLKGKKWIIGSSAHGCWLGSYEYEKQRRFAQEVDSGSVVYDVGANVGFYTLLASELAGPKGQVIAFEPLPRNLRYLYRHLTLNRISNVEVIEAAVADQSGVLAFHEGPHNAMGRLSEDGQLEVQAVSLDLLYANQRIPKPDFIKIDIEGGEFRALQGAKHLLTEAHPVLFLATHGQEIHRQCLELLREFGYWPTSLTERAVQDTDELICKHDGCS
jgi:FkbM family methyltransferase